MRAEATELIKSVQDVTGEDHISSVCRDVAEENDIEVTVRQRDSASIDVNAAARRGVDEISVYKDDEGWLKIGLFFSPWEEDL